MMPLNARDRLTLYYAVCKFWPYETPNDFPSLEDWTHRTQSKATSFGSIFYIVNNGIKYTIDTGKRN